MKRTGLLVLTVMALFVTLGSGAIAQSTNPANTGTVTVTMNAQNGSGESGTATLTEKDGKLMVSLNLSNGTAEPQPAHIHTGSCSNLDPKPTYPLTNVVNGKSDTTLDINMATLASGQYAVNVHKSAAEVSTYVSCGDIVNMAMTSGSSSGGSTEESPGIPPTGGGDNSLFLAALALVALGLLGAGLKLSRRKA